MAQTTIDQRIQMTEEPRGMSHGPVAAGILLPHGTMCFVDGTTGEQTNTPNAGANKFSGIVHARADNTGGAVGGEIDVEFYALFNRFEHVPFDAITQADVGQKVYATDNWGLTLTAAGNTYVGTLETYISPTKGRIAPDFQA